MFALRCIVHDVRHPIIATETVIGSFQVQQERVACVVGLVDPHGDLADAVLKAVSKQRTAEVALLDASDRD